MAGKAGLPTNEGAVQEEEPGAIDNRLSITPSDFPATAEWEDGGEYDIAELGEGVKLRQISPGECEILPPPAPVEGVEEAEAKPAAPKRGGYSNPSVEALADEE